MSRNGYPKHVGVNVNSHQYGKPQMYKFNYQPQLS